MNLSMVELRDRWREKRNPFKTEASNVLSPQNLVAVAYNNRPHYYFGKVVEEAKGEAVKISFPRQLSTNKYCWPNELVIESVEVEQIFQQDIKAEILAEPTTFAFLVMEDITAKFSKCRGRLEMAKKKAMVDEVWGDIAAPFTKVGAILWKDIKTIQKEMPEFEWCQMV